MSDFPDNLPVWPLPDPEIERVFARLARDGSWGKYHGEHVPRLTSRLEERHGVRHVLLTSSGTAAVELALRGLRVQAGDEVILSAYDFKANFTNVTLLGAVPVLVDVRPDDAQIDVELIAEAISEKTRAILVSHLHGGIVNMPRLMDLARERGIPVIEDACQMTGASLHGRPAGTQGDVGVLSFGGSKLLTAGRGGAVLTDREDVAQRIRLHTQRGNEAYPLSELQAAVLIPQLDRLDELRRHRRETVDAIRTRLAAAAGLLRMFPAPGAECEPDFYKVGFWFDAESSGQGGRGAEGQRGGGEEGMGGPSRADLSSSHSRRTRESFSEAMRGAGIPLDPGFSGLHRVHARRRYRAVGELLHADRADASLLVLHHPFLLAGETAVERLITELEKPGS
jgi:perosamine synthetase